MAPAHTAFALAGLRFVFEAPNGIMPTLPREYDPFIALPASRPEGGRYTVRPQPDKGRGDGRTGAPIWQTETWRMFNDAHMFPFRIDIYNAIRRSWQRQALLAKDFGSGILFAFPAGSGWHHPHDRAILCARLAHLQGAVIHGGSVIIEGRAFLLAGPSGVGKTTLCRLLRTHGAILLNDERSIVRWTGRRAIAGSSPWHGEENHVDRSSAVLNAILFLRQSPRNHLTPIPVTEAIARLFTSAMIPGYLPGGPGLVLAAMEHILRVVPAYELSFTPDARAFREMMKLARR